MDVKYGMATMAMGMPTNLSLPMAHFDLFLAILLGKAKFSYS